MYFSSVLIGFARGDLRHELVIIETTLSAPNVATFLVNIPKRITFGTSCFPNDFSIGLFTYGMSDLRYLTVRVRVRVNEESEQLASVLTFFHCPTIKFKLQKL